MNTKTTDTLILGVCNILWADEGFGVRALEYLTEKYTLPEDVTLLDGGTQGLALLPILTAHKRLLIFDAVDFYGQPGELSLRRDGEISTFIGSHAVSLHQTSMHEVLALAGLLGAVPQTISLIGVQPVVLEDYGGSLSDQVRARLDEAVELARGELTRWGITITPRQAGTEPGLVTPALQLAAYESGRPSASLACRSGDERVVGIRD